MNPCPCGSGRNYAECCEPVIKGTAKAQTPEALMRARYAAHTVKNFEFVQNSMVPELRGDGDEAEMAKWADSITWDGLEIVGTEGGTEASDTTGDVTFIARYTVQGIPRMLNERAHFKRVDGEWLYEDGDDLAHTTFVRDQPKVGRNDPCPCGSGRKYKKCCGAKQ